MKLDELKALYERNHLPEVDYLFAEKIILNFQLFLDELHQNLFIDEIDSNYLDQYIALLLENNSSTVEAFIVLLRYYRVAKRNDLFIHLTRYTGGIDVIEQILKRLERLSGKELMEKIMEGLPIPKLGTHPKRIPFFTQEFVKRLEKDFSQEQVEQILTGNNHDVSKEAILPEKIEYENAPSLEVYLKERHLRKVKELQAHCDERKVWFEQDITQEVVDFVAKDQELLSAILKDNKLYMTKIPYDTVSYLNANSSEEKRYFACHCPFARESIKQKEVHISKNWCYCSAGFEKFPFEVILDQKLKIKCLKSALDPKDTVCRFEVSLEGIKYKK
ncbi:MAG: hypothetical protein KJ971_07760 [Firmicutes bacterium]|nr:hypothetical protein [Bacillota bacterium]